MQPPIGISDFRKLIETRDFEGKPYLFVDKSLLIKEIMDDLTEVKLFTRPRRFGKTLNMSMLYHFFANAVNGKATKELFENLKIAQHKQYLEKHQGKYPVIFLTFKDIKNNNFDAAYREVSGLVRELYAKHREILSGNTLYEDEKEIFESILRQNASDDQIKSSLKNLIYYLHRHYGVKPVVLIDEYDTPIQTAYLSDYYEDMVTFMRGFLGAGLKDNPYLGTSVLTGILRVSKESLFSGLNNIKVYSLLNSRYGEYFGFTEDEVGQLLNKSGINNNPQDVAAWYNGYQAGHTVIYNPWSIVNYIQEKGKLSSYWVSTGDNTLIKELLILSSNDFKSQFESLLEDKTIEMLISENINFSNLKTTESAVWTLLLMTGYLKAKLTRDTEQGPLCQLSIPNNEVKGLYQRFIAEWLSGVGDATIFNNFLNHLLNGEMENFEEGLKKIIQQTFSIHDVKGKNPEKFFHGFMLGLISGIDLSHYKVDSNKESGLGRYDIMITPKDPKKLGIILEVKSSDKMTSLALQQVANEAITQINTKRYDAVFQQDCIQNCLKIGIAFNAKDVAIAYLKETFASNS